VEPVPLLLPASLLVPVPVLEPVPIFELLAPAPMELLFLLSLHVSEIMSTLATLKVFSPLDAPELLEEVALIFPLEPFS
jgi:hypothetical protein